MSKFMLLQAIYCTTGILFFVRDLYNRVPMGKGIINAFIWPYAQWPVMKAYALDIVSPVLAMLN